MRITVTAEDISQGRKAKCFECPIGLAIKRQTGKEVEVARDVFKAAGCSLPQPKAVKDFIRRFDMGLEVEPFEFEI